MFTAALKPLQINRFDCGFETLPEKPKPEVLSSDSYFTLARGNAELKINRKTGLVDSYVKDGKNYVTDSAFGLEVFEDNFDPWGMLVTAFKNKIGEFKLLDAEATKKFLCLEAELEPVHIIEDGAVRTVAEAVFGYESSYAVIKYCLNEKGELKLDVRINWSEKQKLLRLNVPTLIKNSVCIGEQPYGEEALKDGYEENVSQRYIAVSDGKDCLLAVNNGIYGSCFDSESGTLKYTLLRSPSYCAHPVNDRKVMPEDRYMPYIEQGERDFSFLFTVGNSELLRPHASRIAQHFNMKPMALSFYPTGTKQKPQSPVRLYDTDVITVNAIKMAEKNDGYIVRLFNPTDSAQSCRLSFGNAEIALQFGVYEIKTVRFDGESLFETDLMEGIIE